MIGVGNKMIFNNKTGFSNWVSYTDLGSFDTYGSSYGSQFAIFYLDGNWRAIRGDYNANFVGYIWDGNQWINSSQVISGLSNLGLSFIYPEAFYVGTDLYLICATDSLGFSGFLWNGSQWVSNTEIISGLSKYNSRNKPRVFFMNNNMYLIYGTYLGIFRGYIWDGSKWVLNSGIVSGLGDIGEESALTVFQFEWDETYYLIAGEHTSSLIGFSWNGSQWVSNTEIISGLSVSGNTLCPLVFNMNDKWYLLCAKWYGRPNGFKAQ